jgi:uncharacterized protein YggE
MTRFVSILISVLAVSQICPAQVGGGSVYGQGQPGSRNAQTAENARRSITKEEMPPSATSMFLDASVLMNVKADEFVAVFGVSQEGTTLEECNQKMAAVLSQFSNDLKQMGVGANDVFVDYVAQNRIYSYEIVGDLAREILTGFELKKNVSVHYRDRDLLDKYVAAAARSQIFDLIKVDYVVKDIDAVHTKLMEAAARVVKLKAANHERLLGIKLRQSPQVFAEKYAAYFPTEMYDSYVAQESENVTGYYRQNRTIQGARKPRTFYFNALNAKSFDQVLNPVVIEPVVQFTLYLKVKYDTGQPTPIQPPRPAKHKVARKAAPKARG